jgi:hypothetical protein
MWIEMKKLFNEFSDEEKKEIIELNFKFLLNKVVNQKLLFEHFDSLLEMKRSELGLDGLEMWFSNSGKVKLHESTCSTEVKETVEKLLKLEAENPEVTQMLQKIFTSYELMVDLTEDYNFANIQSRKESIIIFFENNRRSSSEYNENDISQLFQGIKEYSSKAGTLKELKKLELASLYGTLDYSLIDVLFGTVLREIKVESSIFVSYLNKKVENVRKELQVIFDDATSIKRFEEILGNRTDILFDEKNFTINTKFLSI